MRISDGSSDGCSSDPVVVDDKGAELEPESILVVRPYDEDFHSSEKTSTLLVNAALRKDYEKLNAGVEEAKGLFLAAMKEQSGSKRDLAADRTSVVKGTSVSVRVDLGGRWISKKKKKKKKKSI